MVPSAGDNLGPFEILAPHGRVPDKIFSRKSLRCGGCFQNGCVVWPAITRTHPLSTIG
jgi:hypothetical protein